MAGKKNKTASLMAEGPIKKSLLTLAIPTIIATIINAIYNFADTLFVGMLNDTSAMGAVSVAFPLFMIITAIGQMIGVGSASYISRSLGAGDEEKAAKTASTALFLTVIMSILVTVGVLFYIEPVLKLMGATDSILLPGKSYSSWLIGGSIFTITNMTLNNIVRAEGNARYSMNALIIGAVLNIVLDPIFMFVFDFGLEGAAMATVVGQIFSSIYLLRYFFTDMSNLKMSKNLISKDKEIYLEIFKIGLPVFFMQFLSSMAFSIQNIAASSYGEDALAAIGITLKITMLPLFVMTGYNQGFQPFAAYNYGAKNYDRVRKALSISIRWMMSFGFISALILIIFPESFMRVFTKDPQVIAYGVNNLIAYNIFTPLVGYMMINTGLFQSFGKGRQAGILAIVRQGVFFIPLLILFPRLFEAYSGQLASIIGLFPYEMPAGLAGIMTAQPIADMLSIILTAVFAHAIKKEIAVEEAEEIQEERELNAQTNS